MNDHDVLNNHAYDGYKSVAETNVFLLDVWVNVTVYHIREEME